MRTPEAMVREAERFRKQWGFRVFKLKAGVLAPDVELETMKAMNAALRRQVPAAHRPERPLADRDGDPHRQEAEGR